MLQIQRMKLAFWMTTVLYFFLQNPIWSQNEAITKGGLQLIAEPAITELHDKYIDENKARLETDGYRIQIYNGRKTECMSIRARFISTFPGTAIYWLYEAPEYKVQVGDFRTRLEAEKFLEEVFTEFSGSFVLETKIKFPELFQTEKHEQ